MLTLVDRFRNATVAGFSDRQYSHCASLSRQRQRKGDSLSSPGLKRLRHLIKYILTLRAGVACLLYFDLDCLTFACWARYPANCSAALAIRYSVETCKCTNASELT